MERLTYDFCFNGVHCNQVKGADNLECSEVCEREDGCEGCPIARAFDRLAAIEDILGYTYDLNRLRELVEADKAGRCVVLPFDIGDSVFDDGLGKINEWEVAGFSIGECHFDSNVCGDLYDGKLVVHTKGKSLVGVKLNFPESAIGSYAFVDHDVAEVALYGRTSGAGDATVDGRLETEGRT